MSFWNLNDGTNATQNTSGNFELETADLTPIPDNTGCIAAIEEAKWDEYEGDRYISLKWKVLKPSEYAKRVIFHKVKVMGTSQCKDPKATADKAKRMLGAIDANAGGKLMKLQGEPTDMDLMSALVGKMMAIKVKVWKITDKQTKEVKQGNWICAVAPAKSGNTPPEGSINPPVQPVQAAAPAMDFDEDVPF